MTANRTDNNVFSGMIFESHGPAFNATPFNPSAVSYSPVGAGTLTFTDVNNATFAYTVNAVAQTKAITRMVFGTLPICTSATQVNLASASNVVPDDRSGVQCGTVRSAERGQDAGGNDDFDVQRRRQRNVRVYGSARHAPNKYNANQTADAPGIPRPRNGVPISALNAIDREGLCPR
jgi:hypothetical protein